MLFQTPIFSVFSTNLIRRQAEMTKEGIFEELAQAVVYCKADLSKAAAENA